ncbi:hypothetical protein F2Q69_00055738 [Brassica cretica]|uniref:Uncharacterized protein n=1 Tax=Brassica cretica TaxID=69181 RepID=A0A8S9N8F8_BRACR|nr:hypothetical protein F2Q69_00055738 [Brassica cretica]
MTAKSSPNDNPTTPKVVKDKDIVEPSQQPLLVVDQGASANHSYHSDFDQETSNTLSGTRSPSFHLQHEKPATMLMAVTIPSTLVDSQSTPIDTHIMEPFPSDITNNAALGSSGVGAFTTSPVQCAFESPSHFTVLGDDVDEVEIESSSQFSLTRGGRESKAPIKYHNMEWKTVRERGKRGRRGRGFQARMKVGWSWGVILIVSPFLFWVVSLFIPHEEDAHAFGLFLQLTLRQQRRF